MKIVTIPDLHGKDFWKEIDICAYDKLIFLGDYVDSPTHSSEEIISNLSDIVNLKKANPDKVVLLIGNHDLQYIYYPNFQCSGFDNVSQVALTEIFRANRDFFQFAYQIRNHLWTHAGVSNNWLNVNKNYLAPFVKEDLMSELATCLNNLGKKYPHVIAETSYKRGGESLYGGILWADKSETENDFLAGFHQYVGHTKVYKITYFGDEFGSIRYLDCLNEVRAYYSILITR